MSFWLTTTAQLAAKVDRLRAAEARLLSLAHRFGSSPDHVYQIKVLDTPIPRSIVPLVAHDNDLLYPEDSSSSNYIIHGIHVQGETNEDTLTKSPLVMLHGYMNGAAYFYRNLVGLSRHFPSVYALDLLGWGLSSRPKFDLKQSSNGPLNVAEDFFVESLEAWRKAHDISRMILCGHSMGGYLSVAYAERYPQHVERLVLLSPVGVPREESPTRQERFQRARQESWRFRIISSLWLRLFDWNMTVGDVLRWMPQHRSYSITSGYVQQRLPALRNDPEEQQAVAEYLHLNNTLPGSGEYCVKHLLTPWIMGRKPTEERIPKLNVPFVSFLYGSNDWMDVSGGLKVQAHCQDSNDAPNVSVYQVSQAGHLVMLDNYNEMNAGLVLAAGGTVDPETPLPQKLSPQPEHYNVSAVPNNIELNVAT